MSKILTSKQRIMAFLQLGHILQNPDEQLSSLISSAKQYNAWFTPQSTAMAVKAISEMLNQPDLDKWIDANTDEPIKTNAIGLILAGNIPLVGFHDEPQCAAVCPVDCCVDDEDVRETREELLAKKAWLHVE